MAPPGLTSRVHRELHAAVAFLVLWQLAVLAGAPRTVAVTLGLLGFVLHVVFAKAFTLVPSYFERELAVPWAPTVQLPLTAAGALGLAAAAGGWAPDAIGAVGALAWFAGVLVFAGAMGWTLRGNLLGAATGTGEPNADRRAVDRFANAFVPVAGAYLLVGAYELAASWSALPTLLGGYPPRASHLLAAGAVTLLLFAVGFRLLPRFLVARPPRLLVGIVLPAGAIGPALLATYLPAGPLFVVGAALEATAVVGFAAAYAWLFHRSDRRRIGFYPVGAGMLAGVAAVGLGLHMATAGFDLELARAHARLNLLGFLGLTIVGVTYQFYPPAAGRFRGASDRVGLAVAGLLAVGLLVEVGGLLGGVEALTVAGRALALVGAVGYAALLVGLLRRLRNR
ncbi:MAG: hypothetical protein U5J98_00265 [Halobacteriales archaeon]|nr:hypothetical protein [Halobacteriales archaeon]